MIDFTRNWFTNTKINQNTNIDVETKIIFVSDFFVEQLMGGAEASLASLIKKTPYKYNKIQSQNLTPEFVKQHKDKYWIFGNFTLINPAIIPMFIDEPNIKYSVVEFDFKCCAYRSPFLHFVQTKTPCNCHLSPHGQAIKQFYLKAQKLFWMSEKQRDIYLSVYPELDIPDKNIILSSVFEDETLDKLIELREKHKNSEEKQKQVWLILSSNSPIKGTQQTIEWCKNKKLNAKVVGNMPYENFLEELAKSYGLIFRPFAEDTCARISIESKLLGLKLELNSNVLHKNESWFKDIETCEKYLRTRADYFWQQVQV